MTEYVAPMAIDYVEPDMDVVDDTFNDLIAKRVMRLALNSGQYGIVTNYDQRNYTVKHAEGEFEIIINRIKR